MSALADRTTQGEDPLPDALEASVEQARVRAALRRKMFGHVQWTAVGRFQIRDKLGAGGMGVVYSAHDPELDRRVAIKLLSTNVAEGSRSERLRLEAQAMAKLNHPNVATVYEVGTHEGRLFVAMELIEGRTVREWIDTQPSWREVLDVFVQAADGLVAAHEAGMVHRDFKPDNAMIGKDGRVRVLDFGLVASLGQRQNVSERSADSDVRLTVTGAVLGTPAYMSPEQLAGETVDERSDQFAFCVSLFEALYGCRPYEGDTLDTLRSAVQKGAPQPPRNRRGPAWLRAAVLRGLRRDPADRWPSMRVLVERLRWGIRRRYWRLGGGLTAVGAGSVAAVMLSMQPVRASAPAAVATPTEAPCAEVDDIGEVWDRSVRERLEARFAESEIAVAPAAFRIIGDELDTFAEDWRRALKATCDPATEKRRRWRELDCLNEGLEEFSFYVGAIGFLPRWTVVQYPQDAVTLLPDPLECRQEEIVRSMPAPPRADEVEDVSEIRSSVRASLAMGVKSAKDVADAFDPIVARAEALRYPVLAEVLVTYAERTDRVFGDPSPILERAIAVAEKKRHERALARARILLAKYLIGQGNALGLGSALDDAEIAVERAGRPLDLRVALLAEQARFAVSEARFDDAREASDDAIAQVAARYGEEDPRTLAATTRAILIHRVTGDLDGLRRRLDRVHAWAETVGLRQHPEIGTSLRLLAQALWLHGDRDAAESALQRASAIFAEASPPIGSEVVGPRARDHLTRQLFELRTHRCDGVHEAAALAREELPADELSNVHAAAVIGIATACGPPFGEHPTLGLEADETKSVGVVWRSHLMGGRAVQQGFAGDRDTMDATLKELGTYVDSTPGLGELTLAGWSAMAHFASGDDAKAWDLTRKMKWPAAPTDETLAAFHRMFLVFAGYLAATNDAPQLAVSSLDQVMPTMKTCCADEPMYALGLVARAELSWGRGERDEGRELARQAQSILAATQGHAELISQRVDAWLRGHRG